MQATGIVSRSNRVIFPGLVEYDLASAMFKTEGNVNQVAQAFPDCFLALRGYELQDEPPPSRAEDFTSKSARPFPSGINIVNPWVGNLLAKLSFYLPGFIE